MEIRVSVEVTDDLWRAVNAVQGLEKRLTDEQFANVRQAALDEMTDAANRIAREAFELGRAYEKRNAS